MDCEPEGAAAADAESAVLEAPDELAELAELAALLARVTGEGDAWAARITPDLTLEAGLGLDSVELVVLDALLRGRHGAGVDLPAWLGTFDLDQIIGLTVGDLLVHLGRLTAAAPSAALAASASTRAGR